MEEKIVYTFNENGPTFQEVIEDILMEKIDMKKGLTLYE